MRWKINILLRTFLNHPVVSKALRRPAFFSSPGLCMAERVVSELVPSGVGVLLPHRTSILFWSGRTCLWTYFVTCLPCHILCIHRSTRIIEGRPENMYISDKHLRNIPAFSLRSIWTQVPSSTSIISEEAITGNPRNRDKVLYCHPLPRNSKSCSHGNQDSNWGWSPEKLCAQWPKWTLPLEVLLLCIHYFLKKQICLTD